MLAKVRGSGPKHGARPMDIIVGRSIRDSRVAAGMSQEALAKVLGITFQQVQKYESAKNRVSASRLHDIATALDVPIWMFFEE